MALSTSAHTPSDRPAADDAKSTQAEPEPAVMPEDKSAAESGKKKDSPAKPIGRAPIIWKQTTKAEFGNGTMTGVAATTGDLLMLAGCIQPLCDIDEMYVWCVLPDGKGNLLAGTGNHGIVYKVSPAGKAVVLYDSPELEVHSLAMDSGGNIYAGTSPNGIVYKIDSAGKATVFFDADEKYVTALATDGKGNLYAAVGGKCKVYRIAPDGKVETALDTPENHALSLAVDKNDNVYAGTGLNGIVYKITSAGAVSILYDAAEDSVTALAVDSNGTVFAGTSPKGVIYKLAPGAAPKAVFDKAGQGILGINIDGRSGIFAANAANVFEVLPDDTVCTLSNEHDLQFLSLATSNGQVYVGTGNAGGICRADIADCLTGVYDSPVHDCGSASRWGIMDWVADQPKGAAIEMRTRTGFAANPDQTWSDWSAPTVTPGLPVSSPAGRYIQYQATLRAPSAADNPKLKDVSIVYLPKNRAPKVTLTSPKGGERWSKKQTIKWTASDPDKDTLTYDLFCSDDDGATWKPLKDKIEPAAGTEESPQESKPSDKDESKSDSQPVVLKENDPQKMLAEMTAELGKHPEIPQDIKDKILTEAPEMIQKEAEADSEEGDEEAALSEEPSDTGKESGNGTKGTTFKWDTANFKEGRYLIKIVGSDRLSNAVDAASGEAISGPILVTNKSPNVRAFENTLTIQPDKSAKIEGIAFQSLVAVAGVQYRIDEGDWATAAAADGIFDSQIEGFTIGTQPLTKGSHTLEIEAIDQAGNSATAKVAVTVD
jgi:hypothetical protein